MPGNRRRFSPGSVYVNPCILHIERGLHLHRFRLLCGFAGAVLAFAYPHVFPTGVTLYNPAKAYNTFVFFAPLEDGIGQSFLIDMNGNEVHHWTRGGFPPLFLDPAVTGGKLGHVLVQLSSLPAGSGEAPGRPAIFRNKEIGEVNWQDKVVWQWGSEAPGGAARQHHDIHRLANGDTLLLSTVLHAIPGFTLPKLSDDAIYEVNRDGKVVWQWLASEHLAEFGFTPQELELVKHTKNPDYLHLNDMTPLGPNKWFNQGDQRFNPDNILIGSREANFVLIIDKKTGKVVWRIGPNYPARAGGRQKLPRPVDQLVGQHDPHLIAPGLPGEGDLLLFDNEGEAGYPPAELQTNPGSRVLEIDPVKKQIVWQYTGLDSDRAVWTFHSSFISNAERLPNGNTFIDEGMNGRFFQITPTGEIVWEYVNPHFTHANVGGGRSLSNAVYRAQPVPYNWAPEGTPHSERAVTPPDLGSFRVPSNR
jgi:Arylsulfotransferase (ASST)